MSSYVESSFSIQTRKLREIVNQCEQQLQLSVDKLLDKQLQYKHEKDDFNKKKKTAARQQAIENEKNVSIYNEMKQKLYNKCESLLKVYKKDIDPKIEKQLQDIKNQIIEGDLKLNDIAIIIDKYERDIIEKIQNTNAMKKKILSEQHYHAPINISEKRKGVTLDFSMNRHQKIASVDSDIVALFERKLQELKQNNDITDLQQEKIISIEKMYHSTPVFAKELFASKTVNELDEMERTIYKKQKQKNDDEKQIKMLKLKYQALKQLLCEVPATYDVDLDKTSLTEINILCNKLEELYIMEQKKIYITSSIKTVLKKHNISFYEMDTDKNVTYKCIYDDNIMLKIEGLSQNQFIMEMCGTYFGEMPTIEDRRKSVSSAKKACSFLKKIRKELELDYGVIFNDIETDEPEEENIQMVKEINENTELKKYFHKKEQIMSLQ